MRRATLLRLPVAFVLAGGVAAPSPAHAADPEHDPTVVCEFWRQAGTIVYAGVAHAAVGHAPPTSLTIRCTFTNAFGRFVTFNSAPGPVVAIGHTAPLMAEKVTVCESAVATYADGHIGRVPERCRVPA